MRSGAGAHCQPARHHDARQVRAAKRAKRRSRASQSMIDVVTAGQSSALSPFTRDKAIAFWRCVAWREAGGARGFAPMRAGSRTAQLICRCREQTHRADSCQMLVHRRAGARHRRRVLRAAGAARELEDAAGPRHRDHDREDSRRRDGQVGCSRLCADARAVRDNISIPISMVGLGVGLRGVGCGALLLALCRRRPRKGVKAWLVIGNGRGRRRKDGQRPVTIRGDGALRGLTEQSALSLASTRTVERRRRPRPFGIRRLRSVSGLVTVARHERGACTWSRALRGAQHSSFDTESESPARDEVPSGLNGGRANSDTSNGVESTRSRRELPLGIASRVWRAGVVSLRTRRSPRERLQQYSSGR